MRHCIILLAVACAAVTASAAEIIGVRFDSLSDGGLSIATEPRVNMVGGDVFNGYIWLDGVYDSDWDYHFVTRDWTGYPGEAVGFVDVFDYAGSLLVTNPAIYDSGPSYGLLKMLSPHESPFPKMWPGPVWAEFSFTNGDDTIAYLDGQFVVMPAPSAILLASLGVGCVGWLRRRG